MRNKPEKFECTQCGSTAFIDEGNARMRCAYCNSLYRIPEQDTGPSGPKVIIKKGAHVIFGKNSNVTIRGGMLIEDGAYVSFLGKLELIEKSDDAAIEDAKRKLRR
ncbi:MAG TPA: hypothetical protein PLD91_10095 [Spirochaetota bacterium]|nr:hypothetical protein [Spirochaetota bacterium]HRS77380.1 hypothetical protein [Spirochaetota bacterium]HRT74517.1 hypothetical protein [Spirochaetota bacterium]